MFEAAGGHADLLAAIGVLAMVNGALIQILMASRILFGLARDGGLPRTMARVSPRTRAPIPATLLVASCVAVLALFFAIAELSEGTSLFTLLSFSLVNASLIRIQSRPDAPAPAFRVPRVLPWLGLCTTTGLLLAWPWTAL